ncbi:MAG: hypothetical protein WB647_01410 [Roseiarcus sp.]|uniref:hypothetical protein n=1 Tax=Roseiarcus sp. TaxID=1969460 RepID=UPI003C487DF6
MIDADETGAASASKTSVAEAGASVTDDKPPTGATVAGLDAATLAWKLRSPTSLAPGELPP